MFFGGRRIDWNQTHGNTNRLQALRGSSQCPTIHACTLEAMRTQASPDLCAESQWLIALNFNSHTPHLSSTAFSYCHLW